MKADIYFIIFNPSLLAQETKIGNWGKISKNMRNKVLGQKRIEIGSSEVLVRIILFIFLNYLSLGV